MLGSVVRSHCNKSFVFVFASAAADAGRAGLAFWVPHIWMLVLQLHSDFHGYQCLLPTVEKLNLRMVVQTVPSF